MTYKIRYTPEAQRDMDAVWDGVLKVSGDYDTADKYVEGLADAIADMKRFPRSGIPLEHEGLFTGYYAVQYKAYRAFYRIRDEYIEVLRIILLKQDYMKVLLDLAGKFVPNDSGAILHEEKAQEEFADFAESWEKDGKD